MGGELSDYETELHGVKTTLRLTEEDAKLRGLSKPAATKSAKKAPAPANKARKAPNKKA